MAYTTPAAVRLVLAADGDPTDLSSAAGLDDTTLNGPCQSASDQVDAYLAARYPTPLADPPNVVGDIATDIAAYLATLTFRKGQPVDTTDPVWLRYQRALKMLVDISTGTAMLPAVGGPPTTPAGQIVVSNPIAGPLFSPDDFGLVRQPAGNEIGPRRWWGG